MPWTPRGDGQMPGERRRSMPSVVAVRASATHTGPHTMAALAQTARRPVSCARVWRTSEGGWNLQPDLQPLRWRRWLLSTGTLQSHAYTQGIPTVRPRDPVDAMSFT